MIFGLNLVLFIILRTTFIFKVSEYLQQTFNYGYYCQNEAYRNQYADENESYYVVVHSLENFWR